jgi:2-succinyl-6-hydroxy-2,4-cyclohexadiene-1-carboxylate synthase
VLDLPGHGELADSEEAITFPGCVQSVLARAPERFALCGYSLGGRIALHIALAAPARLRRLILIGASPGIEDPRERERRREQDRRLADSLEREPFEAWIERWRSQPLFAGEGERAAALAREDQRRNDPRALARVLRGLGTGEMAPLWDRLHELEMPVLLIHGSADQKFAAIAHQMAQRIPRAEVLAIEGGHGLVLGNPAAVAAAIQERPPQRAHPAGAQAPAR